MESQTADTPILIDPESQSYRRSESLFRLAFRVATVRGWLEYHLATAKGEPAEAPLEPFVDNDSGMDPPNLIHLGQVLGLSWFEQQILILVLATELDPQIGELCGALQGNANLNFPTPHLTVRILPEACWGSFLPDAPLLRWELIRMDPGSIFSLRPLRIDPAIMLYLMGEPLQDNQLRPLIRPLSLTRLAELPPSHQPIAAALHDIWVSPHDNQTVVHPVLQFCCHEFSSTEAILADCQGRSQQPIYGLSMTQLATTPSVAANSNQLQLLLLRWERIARLTQGVLLINSYGFAAEGTHGQLLQQILSSLATPVVLAVASKVFLRDRPIITFDIPNLNPGEQRTLWKHHLGDALVDHLGPSLETLVAHFNLNGAAIAAVCQRAEAQLAKTPSQESPTSPGGRPATIFQTLWTTSREQARPRLDALAQRLETQMSLADLILPETQLNTLKTIVAHTQKRAQVYQSWGWQRRSSRGLGISALFHGLSGTGKTTAAEVIARELDLDLYRVDLSAVVSKYIGETEKNLSQIFNVAEAGGVVLLFDEADALFGKRGEVREARDRYANQEVSYLLQRMEAYAGLAILTTNLKSSMDKAFERRLRFVVEFPFPDIPQRMQLWQKVFPSDTPLENLDYRRLARLNVSGGVIRNIALSATFIAAENNESVGMQHLVLAARSEGLKANMTHLIETGIKEWT